MKLLAIGLSLLVAGIQTTLRAEDAKSPREVHWEDLQAPFEFEDPFEKLTEEQLMDLGVIARVQSLEKRQGDSKVTEGMRQEAAAARAKLEKQKVDIEGLFAKRAKITELRKKRANAAVPELAGQFLALPGFVLPLEYDGKKVTEFLLVPWVGACIHTPPPPPNQMVHVIAKTPFETKGMFEAVTITGVMKIETRKEELFLVDGKAEINLSYSMTNAGVAKYKQK
jgi:hypothetical protein